MSYMDIDKEQGFLVERTHHVASGVDYQDAIVQTLSDRRMQLGMALLHLSGRARGLAEAARQLIETLRSGHKVLVAGNGGSAAQAQHFAAELIGRFKRERMPYPVLALTTDTAALTAIANDYSYQEVFARQIRALGQPGDLFVAFSTSGESENVVRAASVAHQCLMTVVAITGDRRSRLEQLADIAIQIPVVDTAIMQELHLMVAHILCDSAESHLAASEGETHVPPDQPEEPLFSGRRRSRSLTRTSRGHLAHRVVGVEEARGEL